MHSLKSSKIVASLLLLATVTGCINQISDEQLIVYKEYEQKNILRIKKDPDTAFKLGFLPAAGYIYTGDYDHAAGSVLVWPFFGPVWQPTNAKKRAQLINFQETEREIKRSFKGDLLRLDSELYEKKITQKSYNDQVISIYNSYRTENSSALHNYKNFVEGLKRENIKSSMN